MKTNRAPAVIVVWHHSINGRPVIGRAPVWGWATGAPKTVCGDAVAGDYIVWHDTYCEDGDTVRARPWSVVKARARGSDRRGGIRVEVGIGTHAISHHRRVEDAVKVAQAMLRRDARERVASAQATSGND